MRVHAAGTILNMKPTGGIHRAASLAVTIGVFLIGGCIDSGIYDTEEGGSLVGKLTPRETWKVTGNINEPDKAIDGNLATAAVNVEGVNPAWLTVDLGKQCLFNLAVIDHGRNQYGFARRIAVYTSDDGKEFTHRHTVSGKRRVTAILLPHFVLARYVRFQVVSPGDKPWSIAELFFQ